MEPRCRKQDYQQGTDSDLTNMGLFEETSEIYRTSCRSPEFNPSIGVEFGNPGHIEEYSFPSHAGVDLGSTTKETKDTDDTLWKASTSRGSRKDMYQIRFWGGARWEKGNGIVMIVM